jgi:hypothetical protein
MLTTSKQHDKPSNIGNLEAPRTDGAIETYVQSTLRKFDLNGPLGWIGAFKGDPAIALGDLSFLRLNRKLGGGTSYANAEYLLVERDGSIGRVSGFRSLLGVSAYFCTKLLLEAGGAIAIHKFDSSRGVPEVARFRGANPSMARELIMAPVDYFLDGRNS